MDGIRQYVAFCVWLLLLSIRFSKCIQGYTCISIPFSWLNILLKRYTIFLKNSSDDIRSFSHPDDHKNAAMNIHVLVHIHVDIRFQLFYPT